jgi:hypothetical protein
VHVDLRPVAPCFSKGGRGRGGSLESTQLSPGVLLLYSIDSRVRVPSTRIYLQ